MIQGQQAPAPFQSASLYVGDLDPEATEGILFEMFNRVGPVASIRVCRDAVTRRSLGYAYVNFHNVQDAERALDTMNFTNIKERPCRIMWSQRDPRLRKSGLGNVFVKNLPESVDNKTLFDTFSVFGNILSCKVATDPETGKSKGYGYIHYETAEAATEAITKFNGNSMDDQEVFVGHFVRRQDRPNQTQWTNLYVKHFYLHWDEQKLTELFAPFGNLVSLYLARDADKISRGFAFVNYASHEEAEEALKGLNGKILEDASDPDAPALKEPLYVNRAQKKGERQEEIKRRLAQIQQDIVNKFQGMNLYVKNLDDDVTDDLFRDTFAKFGVITSFRIMRDPIDNTSKGFGFVCFTSHEAATAAITDLHGKMLLSKPIFVTLHQRQEQRRAALQATYSSRNRMSFPPSPANMPMPYGMPMYAPQQGGQPRFPMQQYGYPNQVPNQPFPNRGGPRGAPNGYFPMNPSYAPPQMQSPGQQQQGFGRRPMSGGPVQPQGQPGGFPQGQPQQRIPRNNIPQQGQRSVPGGPGRGGYPQMSQQLGPGGIGGPKNRMQPGMQFNSGVRNAVNPQPHGMMTTITSPSMAPLDDQLLASADPQVQKNMIGERLYPLIYMHQPQLAGKITGMLLEMDNAELLNLIESPDALLHKIQEALIVLQTHAAADSVDDDQQ